MNDYSDSYVDSAILRLVRGIEINPLTGCWEWQRAKINGYGHITLYENRLESVWRTHILSYRHFVGDVPEGKELDHLCENKGCCNPNHLEPVSHEVNVHRGKSTKRTETDCANGHPWTEENTFQSKNPHNKSGFTMKCLLCKRENSKRYRDKHKDQINRNRRK